MNNDENKNEYEKEERLIPPSNGAEVEGQADERTDFGDDAIEMFLPCGPSAHGSSAFNRGAFNWPDRPSKFGEFRGSLSVDSLIFGLIWPDHD